MLGEEKRSSVSAKCTQKTQGARRTARDRLVSLNPFLGTVPTKGVKERGVSWGVQLKRRGGNPFWAPSEKNQMRVPVDNPKPVIRRSEVKAGA